MEDYVVRKKLDREYGSALSTSLISSTCTREKKWVHARQAVRAKKKERM